jgi:hypothetical protein
MPPPRTPSVTSSAFDARDGYTINHLKVELNSYTRELEHMKATLAGERADWQQRSFLYENEIIGLRSELTHLRELLAKAGYAFDSDVDKEKEK